MTDVATANILSMPQSLRSQHRQPQQKLRYLKEGRGTRVDTLRNPRCD